ncbi:MAG TPA: ABC transporter permease [Gemmataceae bacterium]|jgi:ribose transport system permease protein|nr:ABC transporter permease [Gemmataceae bacterium]
MKKLVGMAVFLLVLYGALLASDPGARSAYNHFNLEKRIGLYGIITLGAAILIITGGIDLSIGAVVGLSATVLAILLIPPSRGGYGWPPALAILAVLALGSVIGLVNGLLVTRLRIQAFVVTLCGLFIYRGLARWIAADQQKGLENSFGTLKEMFAQNKDLWGLLAPLKVVWGPNFGIPAALIIFVVLAGIATVFLHFSVYGRYLYAIGSNEKAARYSGIAVDRYKLLAYVLCSTLAAFFGVLFLMENNSVQPSETGSFFELYAITAAVLGGCSLRGGEGTVLGVVIGTAILWILPNFTRMWGVSSKLEFTVIGAALLIGATLDELLRPRGAVRPAG